jgi:hypothetical protein
MLVTKQKVVWPFLLAVAIGCAGFVFEVGRVKAFPNRGKTKPIIAKTRLSAPVAAVPSASAFTLALTRTITRADGQSRVLSALQRFQRSDGTYKLVQTLYDADVKAEPVQTSFGLARLGVFRLDETHGRLIFMGPLVEDEPGDVEQGLRSNQLFAREESVAGITTIVWRKVGRSEADFVEEYRAPSLGGVLIKSVKVTARGREVVEPTAIQTGEPTTALFSELFLYPSDYSRYERQVQEVAKQGDAETALLMRQFLDRMRQLRP